MTAHTEQRANGSPDTTFRLTSVTKAEAPAGEEPEGWYRYVITQGSNTIVGLRQGSLRSVKAAVEDIVVRLNDRRKGRTGRVHLTPGPRRRSAS